jgi:hypothetical protein
MPPPGTEESSRNEITHAYCTHTPAAQPPYSAAPARAPGRRDIDGLILCAEDYGAPYDLLASALGAQPARLRAITADLLTEATAPPPRFAAVVCEDIERSGRDMFNALRLEKELSRQGIPLFATDEPAPRDPRRNPRGMSDTGRTVLA